MGLYDSLYSRVPLLDCDLSPDTAYQTKDLDCSLAHYVIDTDGRLLCCRSLAEDALDLSEEELFDLV